MNERPGEIQEFILSDRAVCSDKIARGRADHCVFQNSRANEVDLRLRVLGKIDEAVTSWRAFDRKQHIKNKRVFPVLIQWLSPLLCAFKQHILHELRVV